MKERRIIEERSIRIVLNAPITHKGSQISEITLTAPTVKQYRQAQAHYRSGMNPEQVTKFNVALVARCAGLEDDDVEQLAGDDFLYALQFASDFFIDGSASETGSS